MSAIKKVYVIDNNMMMHKYIVDTISEYPQFEAKEFETGEHALKELNDISF